MATNQIKCSAQVNRGFTLIELMIVVVIIAIITIIAYPSYLVYIHKTNRTDAYDLLQLLSHREEKFMTFCNQYTNKLDGSLGAPNSCTGLGLVTSGTTLDSKLGFYQISETDITLSGGCDSSTSPNNCMKYTLSVEPKPGSSQASDNDCQLMTLSSTGVNSAADGDGNNTTDICWP